MQPVEIPREVLHHTPRDVARRAFEEDDEVVATLPFTSPPPPAAAESPRSTPRRRPSTREPPTNTKRNSLLGGFSLFSRAKTDPVIPKSKSAKPETRARLIPGGIPETDIQASRDVKPHPSSVHQSSNESRDNVERPHRSRRHSQGQQQRQKSKISAEEEYRRQKEKRRSARHPDYEMSGGRDGGMSLTPPMDDLPPPLEPFEPIHEPAQEPDLQPPSPSMAAEVGVASTSSAERRERRRSKRTPPTEELPRSRRITVSEKERPVSRRFESDRPRTRGYDEERPVSRRMESDRPRTRGHDEERPVSRRIESDRPRTRGHDEERPRPRRNETERRSSGTHRSSKKKEESGGLKSLFGGFTKKFA
jgi:hypothetical protein